MRLESLKDTQRKLPDEQRRGLRLALGVGLPCLLGYGVIPLEHLSFSSEFATACKWAAITAVVVGAPVIGKVNQVGTERTLGTIVGGFLGYLFFKFGSYVWTPASDGVFLSLAAMLVAWSSAILGSKLNLDTSARLYVITFLLVCFGSADGKDPLRLALFRMSGIIGGVLLMLLLSILVLPRSASVAGIYNLEDALSSLQKLAALAWQDHLPPDKLPGPLKQQQQQAAQQQALSPAGASSKAGQGAKQQPGTDDAGYEPLPDGDPEAPPPSPPPSLAGSSLSPPVPQWPRQQQQQQLQAGQPSNGAAPGAPSQPGRRTPAEQESYEEECERVVTGIYNSLFKHSENADLAKGEVLVGTLRGRPVFLPGLPQPFCARPEHNRLPWREMSALATSVRRVARLLYSVVQSLEGGFDEQLQHMLRHHYPTELMPTLATACTQAVAEVAAHFPSGNASQGLSRAGLQQLADTVQAMLEVTDRHRREEIKALQRWGRRASMRRRESIIPASGTPRQAARSPAWPSLAQIRSLGAGAAPPAPPAQPAEAPPGNQAGSMEKSAAAEVQQPSPFAAAAQLPAVEDSAEAEGGDAGVEKQGSKQQQDAGPAPAASKPDSSGSEAVEDGEQEEQQQGARAADAAPQRMQHSYRDSLASTLQSIRGSFGLPSLPPGWRRSIDNPSHAPSPQPEQVDAEQAGSKPSKTARVPRVQSADHLQFPMSLPDGASPRSQQRQQLDSASLSGHKDSGRGMGGRQLGHEASLGEWLQRDFSGSSALDPADGGSVAVGERGKPAAETSSSSIAGAGGAQQQTSALLHHNPFVAAAQAAGATSRGLAAAIAPLPPRAPLPPVAIRPAAPASAPAAAQVVPARSQGSNSSARQPLQQQVQPAGQGTVEEAVQRSSLELGEQQPEEETDGGRSFERGFSFLNDVLLMFPESEQGRVVELHWLSFQAVLEDLVEELEDLHAAVEAVVACLAALGKSRRQLQGRPQDPGSLPLACETRPLLG